MSYLTKLLKANKTVVNERIALVTIIDRQEFDFAEQDFQFSGGFPSTLSPCSIKLALIITMLLLVMLFHS